jgi:hypothetical protein
MTTQDLPEHVVQFVRRHIQSVEQLEVLLLLYRNAGREWTASEVSDELRTGIASAAARLEDLQSSGLLSSQTSHPKRYHFSPAQRSLESSVAELAVIYEQRRYTIIDLIFSKPLDKIRVFANAFKLRREDEDDG